MKFFIYFIIAVVTASVVAGFFIVGSPQEERLRRRDEERVSGLQSLQYQILNYWQNKSTFPKALASLRDDISGFVPPTDPETNMEYGYRVINEKELKFELCADFARPSLDSAIPLAPKPYGEPLASENNWQHGQGQTCFARTIDKDFYKPRP